MQPSPLRPPLSEDPNLRSFGVSLVLDEGRSVEEVSRKLDCSQISLEAWLHEERVYYRVIFSMLSPLLTTSLDLTGGPRPKAFEQHVADTVHSLCYLWLTEQDSAKHLVAAVNSIAQAQQEQFSSTCKESFQDLVKHHRVLRYAAGKRQKKQGVSYAHAPATDALEREILLDYEFLASLGTAAEVAAPGAAHVLELLAYRGQKKTDWVHHLSRLSRHLARRIQIFDLERSDGPSSNEPRLAYEDQWPFQLYCRIMSLVAPLGVVIACRRTVFSKDVHRTYPHSDAPAKPSVESESAYEQRQNELRQHKQIGNTLHDSLLANDPLKTLWQNPEPGDKSNLCIPGISSEQTVPTNGTPRTLSLYYKNGKASNRQLHAVSQVVDHLRSPQNVASEMKCTINELRGWVKDEMQYCRQATEMVHQPLSVGLRPLPSSDVSSLQEQSLRIIYGFLITAGIQHPDAFNFLPHACTLVAQTQLHRLTSNPRHHKEYKDHRTLLAERIPLFTASNDISDYQAHFGLDEDLLRNLVLSFVFGATEPDIEDVYPLIVDTVIKALGAGNENYDFDHFTVARLRISLVNRIGRLALALTNDNASPSLRVFYTLFSRSPTEEIDPRPSHGRVHEQEWIFANCIRLCMLVIPLGFSLSLVLKQFYEIQAPQRNRSSELKLGTYLKPNVKFLTRQANFASQLDRDSPASICGVWASRIMPFLRAERPLITFYSRAFCMCEKAMACLSPGIMRATSDPNATKSMYVEITMDMVGMFDELATEMLSDYRALNREALRGCIAVYDSFASAIGAAILTEIKARLAVRIRVAEEMDIYIEPPSLGMDHWKLGKTTPIGVTAIMPARVEYLCNAFEEIFGDL